MSKVKQQIPVGARQNYLYGWAFHSGEAAEILKEA